MACDCNTDCNCNDITLPSNLTTGVGVANATINSSNELIITLTDGTALNAGALPGVGETNTMSNVGSGAGQVYKQKTGVNFELRRIAAGTNITVTNGTSDITIASTAKNNEGENAAAGSGTGLVYKGMSSTTPENLEFRKLKSAGSASISTGTDDVTITAPSITSNVNDYTNNTTIVTPQALGSVIRRTKVEISGTQLINNLGAGIEVLPALEGYFYHIISVSVGYKYDGANSITLPNNLALAYLNGGAADRIASFLGSKLGGTSDYALNLTKTQSDYLGAVEDTFGSIDSPQNYAVQLRGYTNLGASADATGTAGTNKLFVIVSYTLETLD